MTAKIQKIFALSRQGAAGLIKGTLWCALTNIVLMFPVGLLFLVIRDILDALSSGGNPAASVVPYTVAALFLVILIYICHCFQYRCLYIATYTESAARRVNLAEKLRRLPLSFFGKRDLSDLTATIMADCSLLEQAFSHYIPELFGACISTVLIAAGLFFMNWRLALAALWVLPVAVLMTAGSRWIQDRLGLKTILTKRAAIERVQEGIETVREIQSCNRTEAYIASLDADLARAEKAAIRSELTTGAFVTSAQMVLKLGMATTVLAGAVLLSQGNLDLLTYLVFLVAVSRLYDPLSVSLINMAALFNAKLQIERMRQIEEQPVQTGAATCTPADYDICFEHVTFAYNDGEGVLEDVSFTAKQGEVTALVGPSGGGKSTAAKLAARFWDVNSGRITLGGGDIQGTDPETLLASYAIVFQDIVLFNNTVKENIRLGRRDATDGEVKAAAEAARCGEFIEQLPDGYDTLIGENGSQLSGGERQRISIARALLKDAPIVLLDEATASLDVENESAVQSALSALVRGKTVLVIAHRLRTVAGADKIVVLEEGRVVQQGTHAELMSADGPYRRMSELQNKSMQWSLPAQ